MSEQEKRELKEKLEKGLKQSYENLLRRKAALSQDMVFADENGMPRVVPAKEALKEYENNSQGTKSSSAVIEF